jgi:HPr kinase/phosphorylase
MELVAGSSGVGRLIAEAAINRPGLALTGFFKYFAHRRIQVIGLAEHLYLSSLSPVERQRRLEAVFSRKVPCVVLSRGRVVFPEMIALAARYGVPVMRSRMITMDFVNVATLMMLDMMAPRVNVQGTMVEIMGIGVLIEGKAGMGKSETALGLIKRGHALVSDDITAMRLDGTGAVVGAPVSITRYHMEIRGVGIIHVPSLFGVSSVREEKRLDMVATLVDAATAALTEDRGGGSSNMRVVLGVSVPQIIVRVAPGRDLTNVIETAALNYKLKRLGHDAAKELDERLMTVLAGRVGRGV